MVKEPEVKAMEYARRLGCPPWADRNQTIAWLRGYQAGLAEGKRIVHKTFDELLRDLRK